MQVCHVEFKELLRWVYSSRARLDVDSQDRDADSSSGGDGAKPSSSSSLSSIADFIAATAKATATEKTTADEQEVFMEAFAWKASVAAC